MADQAALTRALSEFARNIVGRYEVGDLLYRLTDQVTEVLGVAGAGVSLGDTDGALRFVTATGEVTVAVEHFQDESRQGPCHDAFSSGQAVLVEDLNDDVDRWPDYTPFTLKAGMQAVAGIPMAAGEKMIGALNVYHDLPRAWTDEDVETAQLLADMATGYIINVRQLQHSEQLANQLQLALDTRVVIEQAKGVIAHQHGIDVNEAFDVLRRYARSHNTKLHAVAHAIVAGSLKIPPAG